MKMIIGGLLEYARTPRGSGSIVTTGPVATSQESRGESDPAQVARHVGALLEPQLKKAKIRYVTDVQSSKPLAIDAHSLQQVLVNLVQNAAQAMSSTQDPDAGVRGNTITLSVKPAPGGIATQILVTDEGPGVKPADRAKVFDPFFTTKAAGVGTGLGLAVCKHLVATAGGSIELGEGPGGRGAEFRLVIPNAT
jgi:C4-dicarboxylate-specific signal transduction histidine kinase